MNRFPAFKALFNKELHTLIYSPTLYAAALVLYLGAALPFVGSGYWFSAGLSDFRSFFLNLPFLFCIVIPLLAMNSWADEKKHGTDRLLAAYPVDKRLLVAAKYAALLVCFAGTATLTMVIPLSVIPLVYFDFFPFFRIALSSFSAQPLPHGRSHFQTSLRTPPSAFYSAFLPVSFLPQATYLLKYSRSRQSL